MTYSAATLATLYEVETQLISEEFTDAVDDPKRRSLIADLRAATSRIELELSDIEFMPRVQAHYFNSDNIEDGGAVDLYDLILDAPLLSVTSIVNGDGTTITSDQYALMPKASGRYTRIRLKANAGVQWTYDTTTGDNENAISVTGTWSGTAREFRGGEWVDSGDTLASGLSSGTSGASGVVSVGNVSGFNILQQFPRFSPGMLISITTSGTTEYLETTWQDSSINTLTALRGARGTSAIAHSSGTSIYVWHPDDTIARACARLAAYYYKRRGRFTNSEGDGSGGVSTYAQDLPKDVADLLAKFKPTKSGQRLNIWKV